jgi:hypothetical protein
MRSSVLQNEKNGIIPFEALRYLQWLTSGYYGFSVFSSSLSAYSVSSVVETSRARLAISAVTNIHHKEPMILRQGSCPKHEKPIEQ